MKVYCFTILVITVQYLAASHTLEEHEGKIRTKRIVQGTRARVGQFPFACHISWFWAHWSRRNPKGGHPIGTNPGRSSHVKIRRPENIDSKFYQCSCAIIHERFVVTAANCFQPAIDYYNKTDTFTLEMNSTNWPLLVRAGFEVMNNPAGLQERYGRTVFVHTAYTNQSTMLDLDVAIVRLNYIFNINHNSQRVKSVAIGKMSGPYNHLNVRCIGMGYGKYAYELTTPPPKEPSFGESKKLIEFLRYFQVNAGRARYCRYLERRLNSRSVHFDWFYLCAISSNSTQNQHNCENDIGGPLVCDGVLMGVLSQRREMRPCDVQGRSFSLYTYLGADEVLEWLRFFIPDLERVSDVPFDMPWQQDRP